MASRMAIVKRVKIPEGHTLDTAVAMARQHSSNQFFVDDLEKIAAEYKGRDRILDAHKEGERVKAQRALWAALPELGPGGAAVEALKAGIIDRASQLLDAGQCEACDALLEFVPEADASKMLSEYFGEDESE
jgi:hypothetical protein